MNIIKACISAGCVRLFSSYFLLFALSTYLLASRSLLSCVAGNEDGAKRTIGAGSLSFLSAAPATCVAVIVELYA